MNMKLIAALMIIPVSAAALSGCGRKREGPPEETTTVVTTEPEKDHSLVRNFTINDIFSNLYAEEISFSFPVDKSEFEEGGTLENCVYNGESIIFPGGGYISTEERADEHGNYSIRTFRVSLGSAPRDFSAYGIPMRLDVYTLRQNYGMPDAVLGEPDKESGSYLYLGAESQIFEIGFTDGLITSMYMSQ